MLAPGIFDLKRKGSTRDDRLVQGAFNKWVLGFTSIWGADWTGFAARGQIRKNFADKTGTNVLAPITCTIVDPGPAQRVIEFVVDDPASALVREPAGTWDCEIYNGVLVYRVVMGRWELNLETTR